MWNVLHNVLIPLSKKSRHALGRSGGFYICHTEICHAPASLAVQSYSSKDDDQTRVLSIRNPSDGRFPTPRSSRGPVPETVPSRVKLRMAIGDGLSIICVLQVNFRTRRSSLQRNLRQQMFVVRVRFFILPSGLLQILLELRSMLQIFFALRSMPLR
jgi:hypothetical protein